MPPRITSFTTALKVAPELAMRSRTIKCHIRVKGYRDAYTFSVPPPSVDVKTSAAQHEAGGEVFAEDAAEGSFVAGGVAFQLGDGGGAGDAASGDSERGGGDVADGVSGAAAE